MNEDIQTEDAETVFRRKFRQKLAAKGYKGIELDHKVEEIMNAPVRFKLNLNKEPNQ